MQRVTKPADPKPQVGGMGLAAGHSAGIEIGKANFLGFQQALERVMRPDEEETVNVKLDISLESGFVHLSVKDKRIPDTYILGEEPPKLELYRFARVAEVWEQLSRSLFQDASSPFIPFTAAVEERLDGVVNAFLRFSEAKNQGDASVPMQKSALLDEIKGLARTLYGDQ